MTKLTEMHGDCKEFVVISEEGDCGGSMGDRLTLDEDDGTSTPYFINNDEIICAYIHELKPYVAEINQFDLVDVRNKGE